MSQAKDKAEELVGRFKRISVIVEEENATWFKRIGLENAKQCALICVDEIIKNEVNTTMSPNDNIMHYWEEVKNEIEKL